MSPNSPKGRAGLGIREWACECGVTHNRDSNAARNILALGHERLEVGIPFQKAGQAFGGGGCQDYDPAAALDSEDAIAIFLADALETGDSGYIAKAMGVVARAKGMAELARETGLSREQLYRSFSGQGNPTLKTMLAVTRALGVDLTTRPHQEPVVVQNPQA